MSAGVILFVAFAACLVIGVPVSISLGVASLCSVVFGGLSASSTVIAQRIFGGLQSTSIMAIAFFVLAGNLMTKGGISRRIVNFANCLVGNVRGGMSLALVLACAFFAALSGSAPATVIAIGTMLYNDMVKMGYPGDRTAGLLVVSGGMGPIIPPSIIMVIYCTLTGASVGNMFKQGMLVGVTIMVVLMTEVLFFARKEKWPKQEVKRTPAEIFKVFLDAIPALMTPIIILGGIYSGLFTPTEAAAVAAVYGAIVSLFIYRGIKLRDMLDIGFEAVRTSCMIMFICATANIFSFVVTRQQVPAKLSSLILGVTDNWVVILLIINVILLINGCFMETTASTYIYTPILFPLISALGYNPIQFGVVMVMNLTLGLITPPLGINLFVAQGVDRRVSFGAQVKQVMPMFFLLVVVLMLVTYIPGLSLCLIGGGN